MELRSETLFLSSRLSSVDLALSIFEMLVMSLWGRFLQVLPTMCSLLCRPGWLLHENQLSILCLAMSLCLLFEDRWEMTCTISKGRSFSAFLRTWIFHRISQKFWKLCTDFYLFSQFWNFSSFAFKVWQPSLHPHIV